GSLMGIDVVPPNALHCVPALPTEPRTVTTTSSISTTCSRTPITQLVEGIQVSSAPDVVLNLRLADEGPLPIRMPGYSSTIIKRLEQKIDTARAEIIESLPKAEDFKIVHSQSKIQS